MKTFLTVLYFVIVVAVYVVYHLINKRNFDAANTDGSLYKKNHITPILVFSVAFVVYSLIGMVNRISDASVSDRDFILLFLANLIGFVCFMLGYGKDTAHVQSRKLQNPIKLSITRPQKLYLCETVIVCAFLAILLIYRDRALDMIVNFGSGISYLDYAVRDERTAFSGIMQALGTYFSLFVFLLPFYRIYKNRKATLLDIGIFLVYFSWSFFSGDRTMLILIALMLVVLINERLKPFNMRFIIVAAVFGVFALVLLGHLRRYNSLDEMIAMVEREGISALVNLKSSGEFRYTTGTLLNYIKALDSPVSFAGLGVYVTELLIWIPTFLFPNRPLPLAEQYMLDFYPDAPAGTGHGWFILTDGYMALGLLGVAAEMLLFGLLIGFVYRKCFANRESPIRSFLYSYFLLYVFYSVRSSMLLSIKNYLIAVLPVILIYIIFRKSFVKREEALLNEV